MHKMMMMMMMIGVTEFGVDFGHDFVTHCMLHHPLLLLLKIYRTEMLEEIARALD